MKGKTLRERARALIGIAHPSVVDELSKAFEERFNTPYVDE
jgi:acyl-CoA hydrolase